MKTRTQRVGGPRARCAFAAATTTAVLASLGVVAPAQATYPGENGSIVFAALPISGGSADLWSVSPGGSVRQLTATEPAWEICPSFSADGRKIATCVMDGDTIEIWTQRADGTGARQLTHLNGWAAFPDWNRAGNRIVFSWAPAADTDAGLYLVHPRSGKVRQLLVEEGYSLGDPVFSPDGRTVLYTRARNALDEEGYPYAVEAQLWTVDVRSGRTTQVTFDDSVKDFTSDWSPDGTRIAVGIEGDLWLMDRDGRNRRNLTNTPDVTEYGPSFSPDGRSVAFASRDDGPPQVRAINLDGSGLRFVAPNPAQRQLIPAWQPVTPRTR